MGVIQSWILCFLFQFLATYVNSSPISENPHSLHIIPFIAKNSDGSAVCDDGEAFKWTYKFHDCFIDRKYKDGGRNLNSIVDRILEHGEACIEVSSRECRPDFPGFISLMNKTISQMKDYSEMYLEEIYKGREDIKDLGCVETIMNIKTYDECFRNIVHQTFNLSEENFQEAVNLGISCANYKNYACSKEAKTSLNRIVRIILGVEQPNEETFEDIVPTTEATTTTEKTVTETKTTETQPTEKKFEDEDIYTSSEKFEDEVSYDRPSEKEIEERVTYPRRAEEEFEEVKPTEAPMMWYDYLAWPFVKAWKWISGLFG